MNDSHRGSIYEETAQILEHVAHAGEQYRLRVRAPKSAARAQPGNFAHIRCDDDVPLRRPLSIMRADPQAGWIEFLYKPVGHGLARLAQKPAGRQLQLLAPIGNRFEISADRPRVLAIGGGVGIPPMIFLAESLRDDPAFMPVVLMGSELPFPIDTGPSAIAVPGAPDDATHGALLLESWGIGTRLASLAGYDGCHRGYVPDIAARMLEALGPEDLAKTQIFACGPEPMLHATAQLAHRHGVPCQLALEEYMACGVGGCAGCTVLLQTPDGPAMKRVCVDGPVFDSRQVYPA